jgi:hypothetical protein
MTEKVTDTSGTPRWVKVVGIVAVVVVVLVVIMFVAGRGGHGPGRHLPRGDSSGSDTTGGHEGPPPGVTHEQP